LIQAKLPDAFQLLGSKWDEHGSADRFTIYPEAVDLLHRLAAVPHVEMAVLTANCSQGAQHKLRLAGLEQFFSFLVSGELVSERDNLPPFTFDRAHAKLGRRFEGKDCIVVGDTPADISCARANGMKAVAVATGRYTLDQLAPHQPDVLLADLAPSNGLDQLFFGA
jgi:phosphoglycolate phosphatase